MRRDHETEANGSSRAVRGLPAYSSTNLANGIGAITRTVMKSGAAVITKHDVPVMVLVSLERYAELESAATPDLGALTDRFDAMYVRQQAPGVAERTIAALALEVPGTRSGKADAPRKR